MLAQIVLGEPMLALVGLAVDHRDAVRGGGRANTAGEPPRQPHQVRIVQRLITVVVPAAPPGAEPARVVPERVVGVEHDPVHAVITARQQIAVPFGELIDLYHLRTVRSPAAS